MKNILITVAILAIFSTLCSCSDNINSESSINVLLRIKIGEKFGFINENGDIEIEPQFDNAYYYFSDDLCFAELDGKKGLIAQYMTI